MQQSNSAKILPISTATITVEGKEVSFSSEHKTVLESLESAEVEVHYHCRDGYCGACRVTLNEGEISYPNGEPLAYVGDHEILPCCCIPITNINLTVE